MTAPTFPDWLKAQRDRAPGDPVGDVANYVCASRRALPTTPDALVNRFWRHGATPGDLIAVHAAVTAYAEAVRNSPQPNPIGASYRVTQETSR